MSALQLLKRELSFSQSILLRRPCHVLLQVTNRCNMKCSFCTFPQNAVAPSLELTLQDFERIAGELSQLGTFLVSIEGGEPFARTDLIEIVRALSRRHITVLYTNGWYVTPQAAAELFAAGLSQVGVSVDYPDERHDRKRGLNGALDRAVNAVNLLRDAAPHGGKQVHIMTVLMRSNLADMEALLQLSQRLGVGHAATLLASQGTRRGHEGSDQLPSAPVSESLLALWTRYPHWRFWSDYIQQLDPFLTGGTMPPCRAGLQSFNIDHTGNVAVCIEKISQPVGNVRNESLPVLHQRLQAARHLVDGCQDCWTACRGFGHYTGAGGTFESWWQLATRMRSY